MTTNMKLGIENLKSKDWWIAAGWRALRTAIVVTTPYVATVLYDNTVPLILLETAAMAAVLSILFSIFSALPETTPEATPWGWAVLERIIKTAAQATLTFIGAAATFSEVDWTGAWQFVLTAVIGSALVAFMKGVPEAPLPVAQATVPAISTTPKGETEISAVPVVAEEEGDATGAVPVMVDMRLPADLPPITKPGLPGEPDH